MNTLHTSEPFRAAPFIKEIGRGSKGARGISRDDAYQLYAAMLDGRVSDLEMGALVLALRIKGESVDEIAGFLDVAEVSFDKLPNPAGAYAPVVIPSYNGSRQMPNLTPLLALRIKGESVDEIAGFLDAAEASFDKLSNPAGQYAPVVIPSYNGSRQMPNLTPLLALLLARQGVPVLVHGVTADPGRVTTAEIFRELGLPFAQSPEQAATAFDRGAPVFMPIEALAPKMARLLALRRILGVRNTTHTLVKILQPFAGPALRLTSYTHPEYLEMLTAYFTNAAPPARGDAFLMRGTEGETVANAKRAQQIEWFHDQQRTTLVQKQAPVDELPPLPHQSDAATTARWIEASLQGAQPVPQPIAEQVEHCLHVAKRLQANSVSHENAG